MVDQNKDCGYTLEPPRRRGSNVVPRPQCYYKNVEIYLSWTSYPDEIVHHHMSRLVGKPTMCFPTRSDTNRLVQAQKRARSLKFRIEELYHPSSENKGADQLRSYCEADLRLCFRICRLLVFSIIICVFF